jgi:hypothetical protein
MKPATRRVVDFLRVRGDDGATEAEIQAATTIRSGAQRVHEARGEGFDIETVYERSPIGARYGRFVLRGEPRAFAPITGTQQGVWS